MWRTRKEKKTLNFKIFVKILSIWDAMSRYWGLCERDAQAELLIFSSIFHIQTCNPFKIVRKAYVPQHRHNERFRDFFFSDFYECFALS